MMKPTERQTAEAAIPQVMPARSARDIADAVPVPKSILEIDGQLALIEAALSDATALRDSLVRSLNETQQAIRGDRLAATAEELAALNSAENDVGRIKAERDDLRHARRRACLEEYGPVVAAALKPDGNAAATRAIRALSEFEAAIAELNEIGRQVKLKSGEVDWLTWLHILPSFKDGFDAFLQGLRQRGAI